MINMKLVAYFEIKGGKGDEAYLIEHKIEQKVEVITAEHIHIKFSNECADALGLSPTEWYTDKQWAPYRHDITRGFHSLYVYCNVCAPQIVGDVYAPLLRCVPIRGNRGEHIMKTYSDPHYISVTDRQVDVIEINIRDDAGELVPFTFGKLVCKLHFRRRIL